MAMSNKDPEAERLARDLAAIRRRCAKLKVLDARTSEDIIGYDDNGLPTGGSDFARTDVRLVKP